MWQDYKERVHDVSYPVYRRVFEAMNIGFGRPSQDDCNVWDTYKGHQATAGEGHDEATCKDCADFNNHKVRYTQARRKYQEDVASDNDNQSILAADMQKVILLPKMTTKEHFFVSRLAVFNETFASLKEDVDYVVLWHEEVRGRLAADVASAFIKCINLACTDTVIFWVDNCSGQNKNWTLFTSIAWCTNQEWGPQKVTVKYLERGHTFMRADSVHGNIGSKMRKCQEICTFDEFVELCGKAGQKVKPVVMHHDDFYAFVAGQRSRQSKKVVLPLLSDLCEVEFRKGSKSMWYRKSFDETPRLTS